MDIKIIGAEQTDLEQLEAKEQGSLESPAETNKIAVSQVLELDDMSKYDKEVETLIEWAKTKTGSDDYTDIKWAIRDLQLKIGTPTYGDRVKNLARFAYLELEEQKIKKEKESYR